MSQAELTPERMEVLFASRLLEAPSFEFVPYNDKCLQLLSLNRRVDHPLLRLGCSFQFLRSEDASEHQRLVASALEDLALFSMAADDYMTGRGIPYGTDAIADQRLYLQHTMLSLMPIQDDPSVDPLTQACHLAGIAYSLLCVFPMGDAPWDMLVPKLKTVLNKIGLSGWWSEEPHSILWALYITGIIAAGTQERNWVVGVLERCLYKLDIDNWDTMKHILGGYLWLPITNDQDGGRLWSEIQASNPFD